MEEWGTCFFIVGHFFLSIYFNYELFKITILLNYFNNMKIISNYLKWFMIHDLYK